MSALVVQALEGNRRAIARLLTIIENGSEGAQEALATLFPHTGRAWIVGVTGAPGSGKSSLVSALASAYRRQNLTVGVIAVDPTSPFTGGAILGDRIRMREHSGDPGVFIRSMATRGSLGGLARATRDVIRALDASGFDIILVETVGAGQSEVDIARSAYTTIVVDAPGMGDDVQAIKAGILEIADILVVNKADRPGADNTERALKMMLELGHPTARSHHSGHHGAGAGQDTHASQTQDTFWMPPIVRTVALDATGVPDVVEAIAAHRAYSMDSNGGGPMTRDDIQIELIERLQSVILDRFLSSVSGEELDTLITSVQQRELDPQSAVDRLVLNEFCESKESSLK